jgi:8-oxo-dGTP pyrophosphatase MutT (NUDIX family)
VALFEEDSEMRVVLTRRAAHLRTHRGEVSFPGGRLEPGEAPLSGALREACEEVGLEPAGVEPLGTLSVVRTFSSASVITPVVVELPARPGIAANPAEVEYAFDVALADLAAPGVMSEEIWSVPEQPGPGAGGTAEVTVHFFDLVQDVVWGATARILVELMGIVLGD